MTSEELKAYIGKSILVRADRNMDNFSILTASRPPAEIVHIIRPSKNHKAFEIRWSNSLECKWVIGADYARWEFIDEIIQEGIAPKNQ